MTEQGSHLVDNNDSIPSTDTTPLPQMMVSTAQPRLSTHRDHADYCDNQQQQQHWPAIAEKGCWTGPAKTTTVVNGLTFRSDFDSGNLMRVVLPAELGGVGGVYQLWTAR